jgi:predicted TIM-barrel fold metal-dependent hydrolase
MTNRRDFLSGLAVGACLPILGESATTPVRIIDTHTHFYDPSRKGGVPWPPRTDLLLYHPNLPKDFRSTVQRLGVTGTVVVEASPLLEDNEWILDLAKDEPMIVGFVGHLNPGTREFKDHLERFGKNRLFRGIRLNGKAIATGLSQAGFIADMQRMAARDLELDAIGDDTMFADLVSLTNQVPLLRIVINHLPFDPPKDEAARNRARAAMREVGQRPQIYAKVSGVLRRVGGRVPTDVASYESALDELWEVFGVNRLVYGSNWPVSERMGRYDVVLKVVREYFAAKGPEACEKYFWKNSLTAYRWVKRT